MTSERDVWQERSASEVTVWTPAAPRRAVEGPLALSLFAGQTLVLDLAPGQLACRECDGRVAQVWLDGQPQVAVPDRPGPDERLWFVRDDAPLTWRWHADDALVVALGRGGTVRLPVRGAVALVVRDAMTLLESVLAGLPDLDPDVLTDVVRTHVQASLESRLQTVVDGGRLDPVRAQVLLEGLTCSDLDDDLADLGLAALHVAVTLPTGAGVARDHGPDPIPVSYDDVL